MRILGIDPGLRTTGFGVLDVDGPRLAYVASGVIRTHDAAQGDLPARLKLLFDGIREVHTRYQPQAAAVEIVFVNVNPQATLLLGQARGACVTALVHCGLPVAEYPIARAYADARIERIYAGTSEIMKEIVARDLLDARGR